MTLKLQASREVSPWILELLALLPVLALLGLAYGPSLGYDFAWDDVPLIVQNPAVRSASFPWGAFWSDFWEVNTRNDGFRHFYRPMVTLSYWLNARVGGLDPFGFHLANVLFHGINTVFVYILARRFFAGAWLGAWICALVFALHPTHTENVTWIAGRTDTLAALFGLPALWLWLRWVDEGRAIHLVLGCGLFFLALLSKEVALIFPLWALLLTNKTDTLAWQRLGRVLGAGIVTILVYGALRLIALDIFFSARGFAGWGPFLPALGLVLLRYFGLLVGFLPVNPHHDDLRFGELSGADALGGLLALTLFVVGLTLLWRRSRHSPWGRAVLLGFCGLLPALGLGSFGDVLYADRFLYLPSVGLGLFLGWLTQQALARWIAESRHLVVGMALGGIVGLGLMAGALWAAAPWADNITLFSHLTLSSPRSALIWNDLGLALQTAQRLPQAERAYRQSLRLAPDNASALGNLAFVLRAQGRMDEADPYFKSAIAREPRDPLQHYNYAESLVARGRFAEAEAAYRDTVRLKPTFFRAQHNLAELLLKRGALQEAEEHLRLAAEQGTRPALSYNLLGTALARQGKRAQAKEAFERALTLEPDLISARQNLSRLDKK